MFSFKGVEEQSNQSGLDNWKKNQEKINILLHQYNAKKVLTPEQINEKDHFYAVDPSSEGLIAYWKFDEGVGGAIKDYTQNGNDGTALTDLEWVEVELGK